MEKVIGRLAYWAGIACVAIAILWRIVIAVASQVPGSVRDVSYDTFLKGAALFLLLSIASAASGWLDSH